MGDRAKLEAELGYIKDLPGYERTNPQFFSDPMIDKLLEIALLLGGEVWANRDRQMLMEHLLDTKGMVTKDLLETYEPDEAYKAQNDELRIQFIKRIFHCLYDDSELIALKDNFQWLTKQKQQAAGKSSS